MLLIKIVILFQFHMVRLKDKQGNTPTSYYLKFQFHMVRLKDK